jgi:hypothetical protein
MGRQCPDTMGKQLFTCVPNVRPTRNNVGQVLLTPIQRKYVLRQVCLPFIHSLIRRSVRL